MNTRWALVVTLLAVGLVGVSLSVRATFDRLVRLEERVAACR